LIAPVAPAARSPTRRARRPRPSWPGAILATALIVSGALLVLVVQRALVRTAERIGSAGSIDEERPAEAAEILPVAVAVDPVRTGEATPGQEYRQRIAALHARALEDRRISYWEVIVAAYGEGVVTRRTLALKAHYRRRVAERHRFVSDYSLRHEKRAIEIGRPVHDALLRANLGGMYDQLDGLIILVRGSSPETLVHEAGHGLLRAPPTRIELAGDPRSYAALVAGRLTDTDERILRYQTQAAEFEIMLQDLNRLHAVATGQPIMNEFDAVAAIERVLVMLTYDDIADAFALERRSITPAEFSVLDNSIPIQATGLATFPDARRLVTIRRLAARVGRDFWIATLNRAIFEAPGHL